MLRGEVWMLTLKEENKLLVVERKIFHKVLRMVAGGYERTRSWKISCLKLISSEKSSLQKIS